MAKGKIFAGIDVGTCKVTTIITSQDEETRKLRVVGVATVASKGIRKSQVVDIDDAIEAITQSVEAAERMAGFSISDTFISVGGAHIMSQNSKGVVAVANPGEEVIEEDVDRVIEAARAVSLPSSREILHVIPRDFIVDSQPGIKDPLSMTGIRLEVDAHIITGASTAIRNLVKCVTEIGINVAATVFSGLAAAESSLTETEKELGVCVIDIGGGTTSVSVFAEGSLTHSFVLPIGAKHITNDLAIGLRVSLEEAEKIKLILSNNPKESLLEDPQGTGDILSLERFGIVEKLNKPSYKNIVEGIIRPRLNEIFGMVRDELKKCGFLSLVPAGIVLSGGGALTVGIKDSAKRTLALPVRIATFCSGGDESKLIGLVDDIDAPAYAVSQGLLLYATSQTERLTGPRLRMPNVGFLEKFSGKNIFGKLIDFIRSFLP